MQKDDITELVQIPGRVILFLDTCHAGGVMGGRGMPDINGVLNELSSGENGVIVFASSTGTQFSLESNDWSNGAFTKALLEGIADGADSYKTGNITVLLLAPFISYRVKMLTGGKQTPTLAVPQTIIDYPIAVSTN